MKDQSIRFISFLWITLSLIIFRERMQSAFIFSSPPPIPYLDKCNQVKQLENVMLSSWHSNNTHGYIPFELLITLCKRSVSDLEEKLFTVARIVSISLKDDPFSLRFSAFLMKGSSWRIDIFYL
jgi:hypothetical protein